MLKIKEMKPMAGDDIADVSKEMLICISKKEYDVCICRFNNAIITMTKIE